MSDHVDHPPRTVFFGSGTFAVPILEALARAPEIELVGVVTAPDRPAGRHARLRSTAVGDRAGAIGLSVLKPARLRDASAIAEVSGLEPELGILADYGRIVPEELIERVRHGMLNVHPSLLPRHRGASPIPATILAGDRETGVTIIRMDAGVDTGPIVASVVVPLEGSENGAELEKVLASVGAGLVASTIGAWLRGQIEPRPQPAEGVTMTRPLLRDDGRLDPRQPAWALERAVRAYSPWPGTYLDTRLDRISVLRADVAASRVGDEPGRLVPVNGGVGLATIDGRLVLREVRPAGGRDMSGADWRRGRGRTLIEGA